MSILRLLAHRKESPLRKKNLPILNKDEEGFLPLWARHDPAPPRGAMEYYEVIIAEARGLRSRS